MGDSGTAGYLHSDADASDLSTPDSHHEEYAGVADSVRQGMHTYTDADGEAVDLFLMLGDNAYNNGDDVNYQAAVFETYAQELKAVSLWPTIGNHEMGVGRADISAFYGLPSPYYYTGGGISDASDPYQYYVDANAYDLNTTELMPYLNIFTLPTAGEAGGVASATEQYYSFDYGNVHIVSLDSQLSGRDVSKRNTMKSWLESDLALATTTADWMIVIFHHPPYSKGANHDSDSDTGEQLEVDMRNVFVPVFQQYGVDLVLNGHAHSYERSYYLKDFYDRDTSTSIVPEVGDSDAFDASYTQAGLASTGRVEGERYTEEDGYVVYSTAGNGGKADHAASGLVDKTEWLNHKAHVAQPYAASVTLQNNVDYDGVVVNHTNGLAVPGSLLIDANAARLELKMLDESGEVLDQFVINKSI